MRCRCRIYGLRRNGLEVVGNGSYGASRERLGIRLAGRSSAVVMLAVVGSTGQQRLADHWKAMVVGVEVEVGFEVEVEVGIQPFAAVVVAVAANAETRHMMGVVCCTVDTVDSEVVDIGVEGVEVVEDNSGRATLEHQRYPRSIQRRPSRSMCR